MNKPARKHKICLPLCVAATLMSAFLALGSCSHKVLPNFSELATGLTVTKFEGKKHQLLVLSNAKEVNNHSNVNIYFEGDGRPWLNHTSVSLDPSPLYPLALHLMTLDPAPAFYIARPCYQIQEKYGCNADLWTSGRYSEEVVDAMIEALASVLQDVGTSSTVTLVGYSGGATLALLLARKIDKVDQVITIAGNLDIDAWTKYHNYTPLAGSLNPAQLDLPNHINYFHLMGKNDTNIPPELGRAVYSRNGHSSRILEGFDHRCCWVEMWPELLSDIKNQ